jgi:hypothetical protein
MFAKAWACAHPAHVVQRALFQPQEIAGFPDIQEWILFFYFHGFSPSIVTEVSQGEFGHRATELFLPFPRFSNCVATGSDSDSLLRELDSR